MKNNQQKKDIWLALKAYHFENLVPANMAERISSMFTGEDASTQAFAHKLRRKFGWKKDFALKAINEYKKFVYLGMIADFSVTPSKVIDQVWHEHILFTKGYRDFCDNVIHYQFEHNPELVPASDQTGIFNAQYQDTLSLYKNEFNMDAPVGIWGNPKFNPDKVSDDEYESVKKEKNTSEEAVSSTSDDSSLLPLYLYFTMMDGGMDHTTMPEFGGFGGGETGGAGAGGSWADSNEPSHADVADTHSGDATSNTDSAQPGDSNVGSSDTSTNDSGGDAADSSSSDSGGGDSGGSSCSSSSCSSSCGGGGGCGGS